MKVVINIASFTRDNAKNRVKPHYKIGLLRSIPNQLKTYCLLYV